MYNDDLEEDNSDYVEEAEGEDGEGEGEDEDDVDSDDDDAAAPPAANNRAPEEAAEGTQVFMTNIRNRSITFFLSTEESPARGKKRKHDG